MKSPLDRGKSMLLGLAILLLSTDVYALFYIQWIAPIIEEALHNPTMGPFTYIVGFIGFWMYWGAKCTLWSFPLQVGIVVFLYWLIRRTYGEKAK